MKKRIQTDRNIYNRLMTMVFGLILVMVLGSGAQAVTLNVLDGATENIINTGFRWQVEEDRTYHVPLNPDGTVKTTNNVPDIDPNWDQPSTLAVTFHQSYMPVVANGTDEDDLPPECTDGASGPCLDPTKNYFISVLPYSDYSIGGAPLKAGQQAVTVYVNANPIPTAQISVFIHEDIAPINNVWDVGERGLEGWQIILEDAGGKYGASAGIQSQDAFGNPLCSNYLPDGSLDPNSPVGCVSGPDGRVAIKNLAPGKYGILAAPPNAVLIKDPETDEILGWESSTWTQTSTIEGTKLIDAWVKANEPDFFGEFGPPGPHVSVGFVPAGPDKPYVDDTVLTGGTRISGQVVNLHLTRPPGTAFNNGGPHPHTTPWVGLNLGAAGLGKGIYAARANSDGTFEIPGVPPGSYQLVVWDDNLDLLFAKSTVVVNADNSCNTLSSCDLGQVPVFQWFTRMQHYVFADQDLDGIWDDGEGGMLEQPVNLRWRDGTIYQGFATASEGDAPFDEVFPFFSWLVAEVGFPGFKATGATVVVDDGGPIDVDDPWSYDGVLNPQVQNNPSDLLASDGFVNDGTSNVAVARFEQGPVLTQAFQGFLGQTSVVEWGKADYGLTISGEYENGGISGMVMYAVTRAEDNPELAAAEPWEPGIPNVKVELYRVDARDPLTGIPTVTTYLTETETDSWDANRPTNCQYGSNAGSTTDDPFVFRDYATDCYDGMRNWNQVRPGVFDGGFAFGPEIDCPDTGCPDWVNKSATDPAVGYIKAGRYVVKIIPPEGYEVIKSQDKNVDFGDVYTPSPLLTAPQCVGTPYIVPDELSLFSEPAPLAGDELLLCDQKMVELSGRQNAAVDFFLFTQVPIAAHFVGFILDDAANEFDPASPQFGEKYAPPFLPVSIRDWTGREISRTVSDEYGRYNALVPSTFTQYLPQPSGISPNMLTTCMNAKTKPDGLGGFVEDKLHNPQYSQFCYTFQYMPGSTTYLDTPVVPVAAFAGPDQNPLDCEYVNKTPRIHSVSVDDAGPYIPPGTTPVVTINSMGIQQVPNPAYDGVGGDFPKTITRDYGFGGSGTVTIGGVELTGVSWSDAVITGTAPPLPDGPHQLVVTRADGGETKTGVTVQVGLRPGASIVNVSAGDSIQDAIDTAGTNDLILVGPGTYDEMVIMWKPVQLQGWGEGSTIIDALKQPFEKLTAWRELARSLKDNNLITTVPGQELGFGGGVDAEAFSTEEGAGVFVLAKARGNKNCGNNASKQSFCYAKKSQNNQGARIDGFTITSADTGGGVVLNGYAEYMDVSNNRINNNTAFFAGGIRVGHPMLSTVIGGVDTYSDAENNFVRIHHNTVAMNGGLDGAGGGIGLHTGSDDYQVTGNYVCGNFTMADGAGIAHYGLSDQGLITDNTIIFNENFNQGIMVNGGGILVAGLPPFGCPIDPDTGVADPACLADPAMALTPGSGSVEVSRNLVQGNSAGAGDGAGIRLSRINGQDTLNKKGNYVADSGWTVDIVNNMIVNNMAALAGGGISLQDALNVNILHNTIANNDNASTAVGAFTPGTPSRSNAQPGAGVVSRDHSAELANKVAGFSDPTMANNILWQNRSFYWMTETGADGVAVSGLCPDIEDGAGLSCGSTPVYGDLAVIDSAVEDAALTCSDCLVTGGGVPLFVEEYVNGSRNTTTVLLEGTIQATPAFDEGGNFIRLRYGPLTLADSDTNYVGVTEPLDLLGDYHIEITSSAIDAAPSVGVADDFDGDLRPGGDGYDQGADEL